MNLPPELLEMKIDCPECSRPEHFKGRVPEFASHLLKDHRYTAEQVEISLDKWAERYVVDNFGNIHDLEELSNCGCVSHDGL